MLLQFSIEPEAFKDFVDRETAEWRVSISNFMKFWRSHGVFVLPVDFDPAASGLSGQRLNDFRSLVLNDSPQQYRRRKIGKHESPDWANVQSWADLRQYIGQFDLAFLERTRAACLDLDEESVCAHYKSNPPIPIEVGRWNLANDTCEVKSISDLAKAPVRPDETPEQIWGERFQKYAMHSNTVVAVDLYAARERNQESLIAFITSLITKGRQPNKGIQSVKIFSTYDNQHHSNYNPADSFLEIKSRLRDEAEHLPTRPVGVNLHIDVYLLPDKPDLREHVRWLRFDDNAIEIDRGLEVLKAQRWEPVSFQLKEGEDDYKRKKEIRMEKYCETRSTGDERLLRVFGLKPHFSYLE